jgi:hypothetical protein
MRPLLDDLGAHQFASYLTSPLVRLWLSATGGLDGIVLALRVVYFVASLVVAAVGFGFLRKIVDWRVALVAATCSLGFVPLLVFAPSYNTIALFGLSVATSLAGIALFEQRYGWLLGLAGVSLGVAAVAYPTQAITAAAAIILIGWLSRSWKASAITALGAAVVAVVFLVSIRGTLSGLPDFVAYNRYMAAEQNWLSGFTKLAMLARGVIGATYEAPATYLLLLVLAFRLTRRHVPWVLSATLPVAVFFAIHVQYGAERTMNAATLMLLAVLVTGLGAIDSRGRVALTYALSVGTCAALVFVYTSNMGFTVFGVGAAAVSAAGMAVLLDNARRALSDRFGAANALAGATALGVTGVALVLVLCWTSVTGGNYPLKLTVPATGPYLGLLTSQALEASTVQMTSDFRRVASSRDRLFVYRADPGAYILSPARPVGPFLWSIEPEGVSQAHAAFVISWLSPSRRRPTVLLVTRGVWDARASEHDYILDYIARDYVPVVMRRDYVIFRNR